MTDSDMEASRQLVLEMIHTLQREHAKQLEPFLKRLAENEAMTIRPRVVVDISQIDPALLARLTSE